MLTFQQIIAKLSQFWEKHGCIIHHGHDLETGAGTFNPATFLRCLGPEPYRTAYVEPSRRPKDARYGDNPNRIHLFHQYQVVIKPSPANIQQLYLDSLEAIGLKLKEHDIRFVQDDWEGPTLGAWGLGWEVWIDGMEITQYTYFQAIGSLPLKPISVEITYGLERLAMFVQNVDNIFDIHWNETLTLRDIAHRNEVEWSAYNFTEATTEMWLRHFNDFEREAKQLIARHLPLPAYDFVIKASHAFNILDARGVISTTERTGYIGRIRDLARLIAMEYVTSREKQGFPLLALEKSKKTKPKSFKWAKSFNPKKKELFLFEIGSEQLPASFIPIGIKNLEKALKELLQSHDITFDALEVHGAPRRLVALVSGCAEGSAEKTVERRGPPVSVAFTSEGKLTPQGEGFFRSLNLSSPTLEQIRKGTAKGVELRVLKEIEYLFVSYREKGHSLYEILGTHLAKLIENLDFPKKMHWGDLDISYPRPLHWIIALFGKTVIPFQIGDIVSGRHTYGHAQLSPQKIILKQAKDYLSTLKKHFVMVKSEERREHILDQIKKIEKSKSCTAIEKEKVLAEVVFLSEWPQVTSATFDAAFLKIPPEILISEMVQHQRYFPTADSHKKLTNVFLITADNKPNDLIRRGNQKVLSARLNDGAFLYEQDLKIPLEKFNEKLREMTFQKELGSMFDKVQRLVSHARVINDLLEIADQKKVLRAALLCKADLASECVGEFPELQGTIGKYYALKQKEDKEVATAIEEHWLPKSEQGKLPETPCGIVVSLADKIDNLLGYFSVGLKPTSSSDPYALRRQTIGLLNILIRENYTLSLKKLLGTCADQFPRATPQVIEEILAFITSRAKGVFEEKDFQKSSIEACMQGMCDDPHDLHCKLLALKNADPKALALVMEVWKRVKGILDKPAQTAFDPRLATEPAEKELYQALNQMEKGWRQAIAERKYAAAFNLIAQLQPALTKLMDTVKIMCDDAALRENRIALLQKIFRHFDELIDFTKI